DRLPQPRRLLAREVALQAHRQALPLRREPERHQPAARARHGTDGAPMKLFTDGLMDAETYRQHRAAQRRRLAAHREARGRTQRSLEAMWHERYGFRRLIPPRARCESPSGSPHVLAAATHERSAA